MGEIFPHLNLVNPGHLEVGFWFWLDTVRLSGVPSIYPAQFLSVTLPEKSWGIHDCGNILKSNVQISLQGQLALTLGFDRRWLAHFVMILRFLRWPVSSHGSWGTRRCSDGVVGMGLQFGLVFVSLLLMVCVRGLQENPKVAFWTRNRCLQARVPKS